MKKQRDIDNILRNLGLKDNIGKGRTQKKIKEAKEELYKIQGHRQGSHGDFGDELV